MQRSSSGRQLTWSRTWRSGELVAHESWRFTCGSGLVADYAAAPKAILRQSSLTVECELPREGIAVYRDDGDDLMLAVAKKLDRAVGQSRRDHPVSRDVIAAAASICRTGCRLSSPTSVGEQSIKESTGHNTDSFAVENCRSSSFASDFPRKTSLTESIRARRSVIWSDIDVAVSRLPISVAKCTTSRTVA